MLVLVVLLTILLIGAVVCAVVGLIMLESWRVDCLTAERERDELRRVQDDLRRCLAAYERITDITAATVRAIHGQVGR
jgi:hypothetical protein